MRIRTPRDVMGASLEDAHRVLDEGFARAHAALLGRLSMGELRRIAAAEGVVASRRGRPARKPELIELIVDGRMRRARAVATGKGAGRARLDRTRERKAENEQDG